jgi:hypothetical protein
MQNEFEMSLLGELSFFLGLPIRQINQGIFFLKLSISEKFWICLEWKIANQLSLPWKPVAS